ncbi:MAG: hypothetical protein IPH99_15305 [Xanthomonadales bacterium]|nr:hypothetical protein [Xanthomonadales bacterium]
MGAQGKPIKRNLTDADSATLKSGHGVVQGYIGVAAVDGACQVIVEAQAHGTPQEHDLLKPVIDGVRQHFKAIGEAGAVDDAAYLADAGYHSERGLKALAAEDIDGYIADGTMRKRSALRQGKRAQATQQSKDLLPRDFTFDREQGTCVCPANKTLKLNSANAIISGRNAIVFRAPPPPATRVRCAASACANRISPPCAKWPSSKVPWQANCPTCTAAPCARKSTVTKAARSMPSAWD